ncbi:MAG: hypothetical protein V4719_26105 [Planctomycetota bacterium]
MFVTEDPPHQRSDPEERIYSDLLDGVAPTDLMLDRWRESPRIFRFDLKTLPQQTLRVIREAGGEDFAANSLRVPLVLEWLPACSSRITVGRDVLGSLAALVVST